jgi:hypothetical protein
VPPQAGHVREVAPANTVLQSGSRQSIAEARSVLNRSRWLNSISSSPTITALTSKTALMVFAFTPFRSRHLHAAWEASATCCTSHVVPCGGQQTFLSKRASAVPRLAR